MKIKFYKKFKSFKISKKRDLKMDELEDDGCDLDDPDMKINSEDDLKEIENEIKSNRAQALLASSNIENVGGKDGKLAGASFQETSQCEH